jgi:hypothetical protein
MKSHKSIDPESQTCACNSFCRSHAALIFLLYLNSDWLYSFVWTNRLTPAEKEPTTQRRDRRMAVVALDLGGTKLAAALCDAEGAIIDRQTVALAGRKGEQSAS